MDGLYGDHSYQQQNYKIHLKCQSYYISKSFSPRTEELTMLRSQGGHDHDCNFSPFDRAPFLAVVLTFRRVWSDRRKNYVD